MKRRAAYALFLLACALPSWHLRDIVAAEAQIRGLEPTITAGPSGQAKVVWVFPSCPPWGHGRKLGPRGQERLWEVFSEGRDATRRQKAGDFLLYYHGPALTGWIIQAMGSTDTGMRKWARDWPWVHDDARDLPDHLRAITEEDFTRLLRSMDDLRTASLLIDSLWTVQPDEAERACATWMRETGYAWALDMVRCVYYDMNHDRGDESRFNQFILKMRRAGEETPSPAPPRKLEEEHETR